VGLNPLTLPFGPLSFGRFQSSNPIDTRGEDEPQALCPVCPLDGLVDG